MTVSITPGPVRRAAPHRPASGLLARLGRLDWWLMAATLGLLVIGTLLVWSATMHRDSLTGGDPNAYLRRHVINIVIGLGLCAAVVATGHRWLRILTPVVYALSVLGLGFVLIAGTTVNGSRSWLDLGGLSVQPAEFAKLAVVVGMALVLAERTEGRWRARVGPVDVVLMLAVAAVPAALIVAQPDLGTTLVLGGTMFGVLAAAGTPRRWLAALAGGGVLAAAALVVGGFLKEYQLHRFLAFTDPALDPQGAGYNVQQARIAIGDGGLFGSGLFSGTQTRAGFVPEQHTDFIFTVAGEELGLIGSLVLIVLAGVVVWRALRIAADTDDLFGRVAAAGIACWFGLQGFWNIGMCLGIMPVTGVPLPLVSYGGSAMFAALIAIGVLQSIHVRDSR